jgi:ribosomal protein S18 acetylase RimI-like enzyme
MEHEENVFIFEEDPETPDALALMEELSDTLESVTGRSGRTSFDPGDVRVPGSLFVVARGEDGAALGCGAFRPLAEGVAEVKRMYARCKDKGIGTEILSYLENKARESGYGALWLETGVENVKGVRFYKRMGYKVMPNFGKYAGNEASICFEKRL